MRIIDEKGRLFGKINIIDFLIIFFLIFMTPTLYFGYKLFHRRLVRVEANLKEIEMDFKFIELRPEIAKVVAVGDKELDENGVVIGEVTWVGQGRFNQYRIDLGGDVHKIIEDQELQELPVKMKLKVKIKEDTMYYKERPINLRSRIYFKTNKYAVTTIPVTARDEKWIQVKVKFPGTSPELSNLIDKGHIEKDQDGRIIGELKEIVSKEPAALSVVKLEEDKTIAVGDPYHNDIVALLNILCENKDGALYFKNYSVKIGNQISFSSNMYSVQGVIIGMELN